jgi:hypothetical protein
MIEKRTDRIPHQRFRQAQLTRLRRMISLSPAVVFQPAHVFS